jgi:hypothetical protein
MYIERGGGRWKEAHRLCCGSRRIDLWRTKEKEREQVYQLLGDEGGGSQKWNWTNRGDGAENQAGEENKKLENASSVRQLNKTHRSIFPGVNFRLPIGYGVWLQVAGNGMKRNRVISEA